MSKYHNNKCLWQGMIFDSQHELERYIMLKCDERDGKIRNLQRQVKYELTPAMVIEGKHLRPSYYVADFVYEEPFGWEWKTVVEDAKGLRTQLYILKSKLMADKYKILIRES